ncbi:MAG: alpha-L-fucosidase [Candidatus Hydrogenedentales bacterium]
MMNRMWRDLSCLALAVAFASIACVGAACAQEETKEQRDARMAWWREAKFGMFIHWGLYAVPAGVWKDKPVDNAGEWIMFNGKIPVSDYEPLLEQFNPVKFNADEWVALAKNAGMKYVVITSKHHDGFALFDSAVSEYDVMSTPFKRDIMKELSEATHRENLTMCWYHSILDWHHPDYLPRGEGSPRPWDTRPRDGADLNRYIDYMQGQLKELLTKYGPIGVIWFDGGWEHKPEELRANEVVAMIRGIQPNIIINNRIQIPQDYDTPEQYIPPTGIPNRDWEVCMTMNDTWGFKSADTNWKSNEDLIRKLVDIVSKGGNFLLNVGPTAEGLIPQASVERLTAMGDWMKINSESIYGTTASPFRRLPWGRCTSKPGVLYLHVFDWPADGELVVPGLTNEVKKAYLLSDSVRAALKTVKANDRVTVAVPTKAPDAIASVVALEIDGAASVVESPILADTKGELVLHAVDATINGATARYQTDGHHVDDIGFWTNPEDTVSWNIEIAKAGSFSIELTHSCETGLAGSAFAILVDDKQVAEGTVAGTGTWKDYKAMTLGKTEFSAGKHTLTVKPGKMATYAVMNLQSIRLKPE